MHQRNVESKCDEWTTEGGSVSITAAGPRSKNSQVRTLRDRGLASEAQKVGWKAKAICGWGEHGLVFYSCTSYMPVSESVSGWRLTIPIASVGCLQFGLLFRHGVTNFFII